MTKKLIILFVAVGAICVCSTRGLSQGFTNLTETPPAAFTAQTPPAFALRTNLIYWAAIVPQVTPNFGVELGITPKITLNLIGAYNPWNLKGTADNNKKMVHWIVEPEVKYWFCERFNGASVGVHLIYSQFNVGGYDIPLLFKKKYTDPYTKIVYDVRDQGSAYGGGVSYNYHWILNKHFGVEFSLGVGFLYMQYTRYECVHCGAEIGPFKRSYMGPTKLGINLIYVIK